MAWSVVPAAPMLSQSLMPIVLLLQPILSPLLPRITDAVPLLLPPMHPQMLLPRQLHALVMGILVLLLPPCCCLDAALSVASAPAAAPAASAAPVAPAAPAAVEW